MSEKPYFVVSDIHLGAVPRSTEAAFRRFLAYVRVHGAGLLIDGDLFDFWFEYRTVIHAQHFRVLAELAELVDAGLPVWFVGGNHDWWGGDFLTSEVGLTILEGPAVLDIGRHRVLVAHGDGLGGGELGYRLLRRLLRSRIAVWAFRQLHPDWGSRIAKRVSKTDEKAETEQRNEQGRAEFVRAWATSQLTENTELDMVIAGHVHVPEITEAQHDRYYINPGDWINHLSYVTLPVDGEPPRLHFWRE